MDIWCRLKKTCFDSWMFASFVLVWCRKDSLVGEWVHPFGARLIKPRGLETPWTEVWNKFTPHLRISPNPWEEAPPIGWVVRKARVYWVKVNPWTQPIRFELELSWTKESSGRSLVHVGFNPNLIHHLKRRGVKGDPIRMRPLGHECVRLGEVNPWTQPIRFEFELKSVGETLGSTRT